jgi:hypothetical protein
MAWQSVEEGLKSASTMAEGELRLSVEFGHGLATLGEIKERVVTEAFCASGGAQNLAFDFAAAGGEDFAVAGCGEDAMVSGVALLVAGVFEGGDEAEVVAFVWGGGWRRGEVPVFGISGGANAGCAFERVDFEAGVVGDNDFAGGKV